jgi:hypothetical protein
MATTALHSGLVETIEVFNDLYKDGCAYAIFDSSRIILFQYTNDDIDEGRALFERRMTKYAESGNSNLFIIKIFPMPKDGKYIEPNSRAISTTPVRLNELEVLEIGEEPLDRRYTPRPGAAYNEHARIFEAVETIKALPAQVNEKIDAKFSEFEIRLKAIEEGEPDEEDNSTMGQIGRLMENPQIMQMIPGLIGAVTELITRFIPQKLNIMPKAVSGAAPEVSQENAIIDTPVNEELLNQAVNRLHKVCQVDTDLNLLADFAETQPAMFQMMLANLRSQNKS